MTPAEARTAALERRRKAQVKAIKASQRQLGLDDETYRGMLMKIAGVSSATELSVGEGAKVLDHMRRAGAVNPKQPNRSGGKRRPIVSEERAPMMSKIHKLLSELGRVTGEPHGLGYADAICKRNGWAEAVDFCRDMDLHLVIGALSRTLRTKAARGTANAPQTPADAVSSAG